MRIRIALHTGEVELRDGDYFGRAVNRAARLRSLAAGGQILCSGATAELVIDSLSDDVVLADLGMRQLKNLARPEHVFELRLETADDFRAPSQPKRPWSGPACRRCCPGPGPFVGRGPELERLLSAWQTALDGGAHAVLIAGEPGVGKTRLAGEWSRHAYEQGAVVLYGRCDEDLGAPYQPFAEALRSLIPCLGASRLRGLRGVEALLLIGSRARPTSCPISPRRLAPTRTPNAMHSSMPLLRCSAVASTSAPVVLILDDLHWAAKPTLLLLRHLLRFGEHARVQIVGTYRSTDLDRSHPLAAMLADLQPRRLRHSPPAERPRRGRRERIRRRGRLRRRRTRPGTGIGHRWQSVLPHRGAAPRGGKWWPLGSEHPAAGGSGSREPQAFSASGGDEQGACGGRGRRQPVCARAGRARASTMTSSTRSTRRARRASSSRSPVVATGSTTPSFGSRCSPSWRPCGACGCIRASPRHWRPIPAPTTSCWPNWPTTTSNVHGRETRPRPSITAGVPRIRRWHAWPTKARPTSTTMPYTRWRSLTRSCPTATTNKPNSWSLAARRCWPRGTWFRQRARSSQLQAATRDSARLAAWGTCFDGQLSMLTDPERLDEIESALAAAAEKLAGLDDAAGEAKAHTVRASCLARLGRIGDAETALDHALTAARRAREHRRVNAVLANAPLAALWGPNPVPRAGGRCLDVVRLLRITTGSPVVEATSTRCQAVLDALRGRAAAGRSLLDSAQTHAHRARHAARTTRG